LLSGRTAIFVKNAALTDRKVRNGHPNRLANF
jgi:hypothetical protein